MKSNYLLYSSALVLSLSKDILERSKKSFNKLRTSAGHLFIIFLIINSPLQAALAPYIPSYDDRYEDDLGQARGNKDYFKEPSDELNYTQYHYVGAHSAERYPRFFPSTAALQDQPIPGLLATGVRGLMLTTFDWSLSWSSILKEGRSVVLSYPKQESTVFQKNGKPLYQTLHYEMNRIFNFLKSHPKAVITILFEDYAEPSKMVRDIQEIIMKNNYDPILRPSDWSAAQQKGTWPTLGWMRKNNKRLILFTQVNEEHTNFTWPEKNYFWKNMTGTMDETVACSQLQHKAPLVYQPNRSLVSFGCYGNPSITPDKRNCLSYNSVKDLTTTCQKKGFASGKLFNGYWADYIITVVNALVRDHKKTVFDYVNELNVLKRK